MCVLWPGFHWVGLLISVMFDTCFHLIIFTVAGGCIKRQGLAQLVLAPAAKAPVGRPTRPPLDTFSNLS
jgi:hypothetical protein